MKRYEYNIKDYEEMFGVKLKWHQKLRLIIYYKILNIRFIRLYFMIKHRNLF